MLYQLPPLPFPPLLTLYSTITIFEGSDSSPGWAVVRYLGSAFLLLAFLGSMVDDKGGAAGAAISSRLGMSSNVRQAEQR